MNDRHPESPQAASLRERAEKVFRETLDATLENLDILSPKTLRASLYELRVHQIELEMQNEELLRAQADLDASRARYFDLYDMAPVGYVTVSEKGQILEANLTAATLLRVERGALAGRSLSAFIAKEDHELYYRCRKNLLDTRQPQECDLQMVRKDGTAFFAHLEITAASDENGEPVCRFTFNDITGRKKSEEALLNLRAAVEQSANMVVITDIRGNIEYVNPSFEKNTGYTAAEAAGKNPSMLKSGEQDAGFYRHLWTTIRSGKIWQSEFHNRRKDGSLYWEMATISPVQNDKGETVRYLAIKEDITARKEAEGEVKRQAALINSLLDSDPDIVFFKNTEGVYLGCNPAFIEFVGRPKNEIVGKTDHDLFDKEVADWFREQDRKMLAVREPRHNEEWVTYPDGHKVMLDTLKTPYWGPDGELIGVLGISRDITEQKQAEEALAISVERLTLATEAGEVGIWDYDIANNRLVWDDQMFCLYGITRGQFGGAYEAWTAGVHPEDRVRGDAEIQMALRGEKEFDTEFRVLWPDGSIHILRALAKVKRDASGSPLRMVGTNWDITEQKQAESEILRINHQLAEATAKAESATAAKSEFLATMTHELRNPLTGVLGFAEILADTQLNDEQQSYTERIRESGTHLLDLINDVLDFSSIEKGVLAIHATPFDLAHLVKLSSELVRKSATDKGLAFHCDVAAGVPAQITGDERRIRQILINLLANAVKFTSDGSVSLRVTRSGQGLDFSVEDTGLGISFDALARLFQLFTQADSTINQKYGGTGIGLAVSQRLAEAMGGSISVVSAPGKGSTFTFRLPLEVPSGGMAPSHLFTGTDGASPSSPCAETPVRHARLPVLVVEDDRTNTLVVGRILKGLGYRVEFAGNGAEAVEAFAPGKYLAILMDLRMPVMNGFEAVAIIRSRESGSRVPIIALSANVMSGSREIYLAAGMDDFLSKPFKKEELGAKLANISQR